MPRQENLTQWATIGTIVAPFGVRGEMKVFSLSDVPGRFAKLKHVYLSPEYQRYILESVRPYKGDMLLLKFAGVDDISGVDRLRRRNLCIPSSELAQLPPDSYYQHDILGLRVARLNDQTVGIIKDIIATGGNDIYVLETSQGKQILIPAIKDVIKQVDLIRRVMYIDPMQGLLDDEAEIVYPGGDQKGESEAD